MSTSYTETFYTLDPSLPGIAHGHMLPPQMQDSGPIVSLATPEPISGRDCSSLSHFSPDLNFCKERPSHYHDGFFQTWSHVQEPSTVGWNEHQLIDTIRNRRVMPDCITGIYHILDIFWSPNGISTTILVSVEAPQGKMLEVVSTDGEVLFGNLAKSVKANMGTVAFENVQNMAKIGHGMYGRSIYAMDLSDVVQNEKHRHFLLTGRSIPIHEIVSPTNPMTLWDVMDEFEAKRSRILDQLRCDSQVLDVLGSPEFNSDFE